MEIDDLKNIWQQQTSGFARRDPAELAAMLKGKSSDIVSRLKRSVWFELIVTLVAGIALLVYALTLPAGAVKWISISILITFSGYCVYYIKKLDVLQRFSRSDTDVKSNLAYLVGQLHSYLRFYRRSYAILYPVYFFLGILFGALESDFDTFYARITRPETAAALLGVAILFLVVSTWFTSWYLRKLYGNQLRRLEKLLQELGQA